MCVANGVKLPLPLDLAQDVAEILVRTGRAVHPNRWVEHFIAKGREERAARLPHNLV